MSKRQAWVWLWNRSSCCRWSPHKENTPESRAATQIPVVFLSAGDDFRSPVSYQLQQWLTSSATSSTRGKELSLWFITQPLTLTRPVLKSPFKTEIMSKPGIFFGLKRDCAKKQKQKSADWMVAHPRAHPSSLHWAPAKVSDKGEVSPPRPPEERRITWSAVGGLLGAYVFKSRRKGGSFSLCWDATESCLSWLSPTSSLDIMHVMYQLPNITIPAPSQWKCDRDTIQGALFKRLFYFAWPFQLHTCVLMKFNSTLKAVSSNGAAVTGQSHVITNKWLLSVSQNAPHVIGSNSILHFGLKIEWKLYK